MPKKKPAKKKPVGRPPLSIIRRCVGITKADRELFMTIGAGNISAGVRRAAQLLRDHVPALQAAGLIATQQTLEFHPQKDKSTP